MTNHDTTKPAALPCGGSAPALPCSGAAALPLRIAVWYGHEARTRDQLHQPPRAIKTWAQLVGEHMDLQDEEHAARVLANVEAGGLVMLGGGAGIAFTIARLPDDPTNPPRFRCEDCAALWPAADLVGLSEQGIFDRVDVGEPMPAGECPSCGAVCHEVEKEGPAFSDAFLRRVCAYLNDDREAHQRAHGKWKLDPGKLAAALAYGGED